MGEHRLPAATEGETLILEERTRWDDGTEEWNEIEATVVNVHDDGSLYLKYCKPGRPSHVGHFDLETRLDFGEVRILDRQQELAEFESSSGVSALAE